MHTERNTAMEMRILFAALLLLGAGLLACEPQLPTPKPPVMVEPEGEGDPQAARPVFYDYAVINVYPHDEEAFTQGLQYADGYLYEGTGLRNGRSSLRRVVLETGEVVQQINLADPYFGEGIVVLDDRIIQLTWQSRVAFVYNREDFTRTGEFQYATEGWGLTFDGEALIMSDGSNRLYFRDPDTFEVLRTVDVFDRGQRVNRLNELEYISGEVYANVWQTDYIAIIDPESGTVNGWIDLTGLLDTTAAKAPDVLNGIAYDAEDGRLFVTGKNWPRLYEIELLPRENRPGG